MFGKYFRLKGVSVVEVILAVAMFFIIASSAVVSVIGSQRISRISEMENVSLFLAQEGFEAVKSIRNQGWENLVNGSHGLENSVGYWQFSGTNETLGDYQRTITILDVQRDGISGEIVESGGDLDSETKKIVIQINWSYLTGAKSESFSFYLSNWQEAQTPGL